MYEIWSLGHKPFEAFSNNQVSENFVFSNCFNSPQTIKEVDEGYRLAPPPGTPRTVYKLMMECWWVLFVYHFCSQLGKAQTIRFGSFYITPPPTHTLTHTHAHTLGTLWRESDPHSLSWCRSLVYQTPSSCTGGTRTGTHTLRLVLLEHPSTSQSTCTWTYKRAMLCQRIV